MKFFTLVALVGCTAAIRLAETPIVTLTDPCEESIEGDACRAAAKKLAAPTGAEKVENSLNDLVADKKAREGLAQVSPFRGPFGKCVEGDAQCIAMSKKFNNPATVDKANKVAKTDDSPLYVQLGEAPTAEEKAIYATHPYPPTKEQIAAVRIGILNVDAPTLHTLAQVSPFRGPFGKCVEGDAQCIAMSKKFNNPATVDKANKVAKTDDSPLYLQTDPVPTAAEKAAAEAAVAAAAGKKLTEVSKEEAAAAAKGTKLADPCATGDPGDACRAAAKKLKDAEDQLVQYETPFGVQASPCVQGDAACQAQVRKCTERNTC